MERVIEIEGHLLDTGLMNEVLDRITDGGGTFTLLRLNAGATREALSDAQIAVSATSEPILQSILESLIGLGARIPAEEETDVRLVTAELDGVAPDDFSVTTVYRTEVRVAGEWIPVSGQRMDTVIVVGGDGKTARCCLMRDVRAGDRVVCGIEGIRTFPAAYAADRSKDEFAFMASPVSSERRVELSVAEIAADLVRIKEAGGKTVVVPGPVVVHTGGAPYLAALIRHGFVHTLLGGNAIATHDMELSLFGTSLGVSMEQGNPVHEGHKHHLRTINLVRRYGSIRAAVEAGAITSGIMVECIRQDIPFALAGSIRDDGPLPDTMMDLIEAQTAYQRLLKGADLVLMLSTMLHSIGVGNMTPAGVKLVCVDINPAVVTKLADRGSVESVGIVTDVGLFLRLLVSRLGID